MSIYTSEKVLPYVYMCTHKITGKVYFGSRTSSKQKLPSHLDFPKYKTSSHEVKANFTEYDWVILAEFFNKDSAFDFEQESIYMYWQNFKSNSINQYCHYNTKCRWSTHGKIPWNKGLNKLNDNRLYRMGKRIQLTITEPSYIRSPSWNTGLTSQTSEKLASIGAKISEKLMSLELPAWNKGLTKFTNNSLMKISLSKTGVPSPIKGQPKSDEHKLALRGPKTEQHKQNMRIPKIKTVSNIYNRKSMDMGNFTRWVNSINNLPKFNIITPDGILEEHISTFDLCQKYKLNYSVAGHRLTINKKYKNFIVVD